MIRPTCLGCLLPSNSEYVQHLQNCPWGIKDKSMGIEVNWVEEEDVLTKNLDQWKSISASGELFDSKYVEINTPEDLERARHNMRMAVRSQLDKRVKKILSENSTRFNEVSFGYYDEVDLGDEFLCRICYKVINLGA